MSTSMQTTSTRPLTTSSIADISLCLSIEADLLEGLGDPGNMPTTAEMSIKLAEIARRLRIMSHRLHAGSGVLAPSATLAGGG
jgi:hypothetical protein